MASTLTVTVAGTPYAIRDNSLKITDKVDGRSTCQFTIVDATGLAVFSKGQTVSVVDSVMGTLFTGYVNRPKALNLYPNAHISWAIDCLDTTWLLDKRTSNSIYNTQQAAVILCDQLENIVAAEGVTGAYVLDYNHYETDWTSGAPTLSNVVPTANNGDGNVGDGDLELAPAGSTLLYNDNFAKGAFSGTQVVNGALELASTPGLQLLGTAVQGNTNPYVYYEIWSGSAGINSGDKLVYDVWVASTSPAQSAGIDLEFSDGTSLRDFLPAIKDQNGIGAHPSNDLSGFATDAWYTRTFDLTPVAGKTIVVASAALEGNSNGTYTAYLRKVKQLRSGSLQTAFFTTTLQTSSIIGIQAYINTSLTPCTVYEMSGTRTAPAISLNTLNIPQTSLIDWATGPIVSSLAPTVPSQNKTLPTITIQTSIDGGATYQPCTSYAAIPNLVAGMSMSGKSLLLQEVFTMLGSDPTVTPSLTALTLSIQPSYNATKTDVIQTESTQANWNAGTLTNTTANSDNTLTLNEYAQNWNNGPLSGQTLYGSNGPIQQLQAGQIYVACNAGATSDVRSRMDNAGQWQNFIAEVDIAIGTTVLNTHVGMVYRTTGWSNTENTFAWKVWYDPASGGTLNLGYGTDGGADSYTPVASIAVTLSSGTQHRMKLNINGTSHKIYLDGVLIINVTNTHYNQAGYIGLAYYNNATGVHGALFDNFGVCASLTGTWQSVTQSLAAAGTYGNSLIQWNTAVDPTKTTSLIVQTSIDGGTTYQVCTNGGAIPNLTPGQSLSGINLKIQALFTSPSANLTPVLEGLTAWIIGQFNASGTWQNTPLGNDTFVRANQSGFGTSWDGQTYTQVGTGTTAIVGNEGQISATTGDVQMVLGSNTAGDEDGSTRFAVSTTSMEAGMELRRVDNNNFYRMYATTTSLVLVQNVAGVLTTLATATLALSINTYYRMRFRVVSSGPATVQGRVWLDGAAEPTTWEINFSG